MKRDTVSINGRVLKGERGPEAIVGALTRCILAQARFHIYLKNGLMPRIALVAFALFQPSALYAAKKVIPLCSPVDY